MKRVIRALEGLPEVLAASFEPREGLFIVDYRSALSLAEDLKKAAEGAVIAPGARKALGEIGEKARTYKH